MGTISEKLTYLNTTKQNIKQAINNLGGDITSSTTFRQYANVLNDIYSNLPKVSDTGTNVSLNPTLKGRLGIVPKGNTYQDSTTGKNLLPITLTTQVINGVQVTKNSDGSVTLNGTTTANTNFIWFEGSLSLEAGTYYIGLKTINNDMNLYLKNGGNTIIHQPMNVEYDTLTLESAKTYTSLRSYVVSGKTFNNATFYPMITKTLPFIYEPYTGRQASPNPDYPQEIQSATGTQKVVVSGKNLLPINQIQSQTINGITITNLSDGTIKINGTTTTTTRIDVVYTKELIANTQYKFVNTNLRANSNANINIQDSGNNVISNITLNSANRIFTPTTNQTVAKMRLYIDSGQTFDNYVLKAMLIKSTEIEEYQPYQEPQEVDIELGNIELNKIGDYEDYIGGTPDNWVLYKKTRKISLNISDMNNAEDYPGWKNVQYIKNDYPNNNNPLNYLCDYKSNINISTNEGIGINTNSNNATLQLRKAVFNLTQTQWKQQYPNLVLELVYGLQEYEQTPITDTNLISQLNELYYLQSYNDTTNIDVTGNLPMRITASAIKGA